MWAGLPWVYRPLAVNGAHLPSVDGLSVKSTKMHHHINTVRPRQNGRHFADDIFKGIILNEHVWIPIKISPKFVLKGPINNTPALVQIMAWRRPGDKSLSEPMMVRLPTHICVTRPQWVKSAITICLQLMSNMFTIEYMRDKHQGLCSCVFANMSPRHQGFM